MLMGRGGVIPVIIGLNAAVFMAWMIAASPGHDETFMIENFLISWSGLIEGRVWTLLTAFFSHNMFWHLFLNMYVLSGFGSVVEDALGSTRFLIFYLVAGIVSSLSHASVSFALLNQPDTPALGASGAISGVILLFALLFPRERILIFGLIPVPALVGAGAFIGLDLWGLAAQARGGGLPIGHGAHLGGALTGIVYFLFLRRSRRPLRLGYS